MTQAMLGGDVAQIRDSATAYRVLGDNLAAVGGQVVSTTDSTVAGLRDHLTSAQATLVSSVQALSEESRSVAGRFGAIAWTGANRVQVEEVGTELDARITETTARIQELFETFRVELDRLAGELSEVAGQFNLVAMSAGESAVSLANVMDGQATQLDDVMNTGITRV